jgi:predicted nucleotide-binding protein
MVRLEPEQQSLFAQLVQARAGVAREKREEFMLVRTFGGDLLRGNGLEIQVLHEDVIALDDAGLIRVTNRHRDGTGFNFVVPASALDYYDRITSGSAEPDEGPLTAASVSGTESSGAQADLPAKDVDPRAVMVVHGRNDAARRAMFDFLRALKLNPLEWGTLVAGTKKGAPYVGEVLDHAFHAAAAVVVLFTPDDEVRLRETLRDPGDPSYEAELTPQARPNVLFEAGMALGLHPNRTILVELGQLRPFSDVYGRHVVRLSESEKPLRDLARRLEQAGCDVDTSGDDWLDPRPFAQAEASITSNPRSASTTDAASAREVEYLNEDTRRWIADRDRELHAASAKLSNEMAARGHQYSGGHLSGLAGLRRQALQEYRDEISAKRRRYRELCAAAASGSDVPRFALDDASRETLARWRAPVTVAGMDASTDVDDPTDRSLEPGLKRFEDQGDGPGDRY